MPRRLVSMLGAASAALAAGCGGDVTGNTSALHADRDGSSGEASSPTGTGGQSGGWDARRAGGGSFVIFDAGPDPGNLLKCECPPGDYFVELRGDGDPVVLSYQGMHLPPWCSGGSGSDVPIGSANESCGIFVGVELSACGAPNHGWPCLDILADGSRLGTYIDRTGRSWNVSSFDFMGGSAGDASPGALRGSYAANVSLGGLPLAISGNVSVCGTLSYSLAPCH